jgi:hypothetical protein
MPEFEKTFPTDYQLIILLIFNLSQDIANVEL